MIDNWYKINIEKPTREIIKNLRNNGINTFCSCGHKLWIQCETYDPTEDLNTIFCVLVTMNIKQYRVNIFVDYDEKCKYNRVLEISFPDKNGIYYNEERDNPQFQTQEIGD